MLRTTKTKGGQTSVPPVPYNIHDNHPNVGSLQWLPIDGGCQISDGSRRLPDGSRQLSNAMKPFNRIVGSNQKHQTAKSCPSCYLCWYGALTKLERTGNVHFSVN